MKYRSDNDKSYGAADMVIGLNVLNAEDTFCSVTIDADGLDCVVMMPDFLISDQLTCDAHDAWEKSVRHFHVAMGMVIADRVSRKMLHDHGTVDRKMHNQMLSAMTKEGKTLCCLEHDEVENVFEEYFQHMVKVFSNPTVRNATSQLASLLQERRTLSNTEVEELLTELSII